MTYLNIPIVLGGVARELYEKIFGGLSMNNSWKMSV